MFSKPMSTPLSNDQFIALRLWAMNFGTVRTASIALWPIFRYSREQDRRLLALALTVPQATRLTWVLIAAVIWCVVGFLLAFVPLVPLMTTSLPPNRGQFVDLLLKIAIVGTMFAAFVSGSLIGTWGAGRIVNMLMPLRPVGQVAGDAELLARIRQQIIPVAIFTVLCAPLLSLVTLLAWML